MEGFNVYDEDVVIGNLDDVKEDQVLIPPTRNVKLAIKNATLEANADKTWKTISLQLKLVEGVADGKFKNKVVFTKVPYFADSKKYDFSKDYFGKKKYLLPLKYLAKATGVDLTTTPIGDSFVEKIKGQTIMGDVLIEKGNDGFDDKNIVKGFKPASITDSI